MQPEFPAPGSAPRAVPPSPDGRVRVGLLCPQIHLGGAEDWQASLLRHTDKRQIDWVGVGVVHDRAGASVAMADELARLAPLYWGHEAIAELAAGCDVVLSWGLNGMPYLGGLIPRPVRVAVSHGSIDSSWTVDLYREPVGVDHFAAVHELATEPIPEPWRATAAVIYNAVDSERLTPKRSQREMRAAWGVPEGAKVLGYIGRLYEETKNPSVVARAAALLPEPWHVVMVGEGPERDRLAENAPANLHFPGGDRDAGSVLGGFDWLCVPSDYESFGLSLCEGLWFGLPVVSTAVGVCKRERGLTRDLVEITPRAVVEGLMADEADLMGTTTRVAKAKAWARETLDPARFGREWTDFLVKVYRRRGKARGSLADAVKAKAECVPCREKSQPQS